MGGKLNVYNAGMLGVNVDKSDVHKIDGEWLSLQNGTVDPAGEAGALRVRDGLAKFNSVALAGSVQGGIGLPLPDDRSLSTHYYAAYDDSGGAETHRFRTSTNGTSWTDLDTPVVRPSQIANNDNGAAFGFATGLVWGVLRNKLYYPGNDYVIGTTTPTIHVFDGTADALLTRIDLNPYGSTGAKFGITSIVPYDDVSMIVAVEDQANRGRFLLMNINSGSFTMLGAQTDLTISALLPVVFQGKIWFIGRNGSAGLALPAYWTRPADPTWSLDAASLTGNTGTGFAQGCVVFKGELYVGVTGDTASAALLRKRGNTAGSWSTVRTSASTTQGNHYGPMIVTQDGSKLLVLEDLHTAAGTGTSTAAVQRILSYDGTTFATEYDVGSNINNSFYLGGVPTIDNATGDIYWVMNNSVMVGRILKRTSGGVWSIVDGPTQLRGPISSLRF